MIPFASQAFNKKKKIKKEKDKKLSKNYFFSFEHINFKKFLFFTNIEFHQLHMFYL